MELVEEELVEEDLVAEFQLVEEVEEQGPETQRPVIVAEKQPDWRLE